MVSEKNGYNFYRGWYSSLNGINANIVLWWLWFSVNVNVLKQNLWNSKRAHFKCIIWLLYDWQIYFDLHSHSWHFSHQHWVALAVIVSELRHIISGMRWHVDKGHYIIKRQPNHQCPWPSFSRSNSEFHYFYNCFKTAELRNVIYFQLYSPLGQQHNDNNKRNKDNSIRNN